MALHGKNISTVSIVLLFLSLQTIHPSFCQENLFKIPIQCSDRCDIECIHLTDIGKFALPRKSRSTVPAHLHTGIDIKRPGENYSNEPIYAAGTGKVISIRSDGPFAQIIICHTMANGKQVWSVYEHIAGIVIKVGDVVDHETLIARFMNKDELDTFGWQFDHFHLEILKVAPRKLEQSEVLTQLFYGTYNLECFTKRQLMHYYIDPILFLRKECCR